MKGGIGLRRKISALIAANFNSICCVFQEKIVKNTHAEERSVHTNSEKRNIQLESLKYQSNSKQIIEILQKIVIDN